MPKYSMAIKFRYTSIIEWEIFKINLPHQKETRHPRKVSSSPVSGVDSENESQTRRISVK